MIYDNSVCIHVLLSAGYYSYCTSLSLIIFQFSGLAGLQELPSGESQPMLTEEDCWTFFADNIHRLELLLLQASQSTTPAQVPQAMCSPS